jgi:DNA repair exonuclease SbcCD ATPase subunit
MMRINKLHVNQFRNIEDTVLDTGGSSFVVVRGRNGQGKTSLSEAVSLALTETTWGLAKNGAGFAGKIRRGQPKATIEVDLQGTQRVIKRTVSLAVNSAGRTQKSEDVNDVEWNAKPFNDLLEKKKVALGIAVNTRSFMSMVYARDQEGIKSLLAQLVLPARYEFPKETIADVDALLGAGAVKFDGEPFLAIETAYKKLYKEREETNRKVKEFTIPAALPRPQGVDSASLKTKLASLREARTKSSTEREAAVKKANEAAREAAVKQARAKAKIETLEATLRASNQALWDLSGDILPDTAVWESIAANKGKYDQLQTEKNKIADEQEWAKKEYARINEISKLVDSVCPTCDQEVDEAKVIAMVKSIVAEKDRIFVEHDKLSKAISALGDVNEAIEKLAKHKAALASEAELVTKIEQQTKELTAAKNEAGQDGAGLFDSSTFDQTIAETDRTIEAILEQIQPVIAAEEREKEIATKKEQLAKLEAKAAKLDVLVKYFDKDGVKAKLIADHIGGFEAKVNEVLAAWSYSCSLSIEPFRFEVTDYRKTSTPLIELSGAEELMFYAAFQCAVSRTAGIGFVVIDRVDTLLPDLRPKLYSTLYKMVENKMLDQVIILVADTSEQVPKLANAAFYIVEEGNIRRIA